MKFLKFIFTIIAVAIVRVSETSKATEHFRENWSPAGEARSRTLGNLNRAHDFVNNNVEHFRQYPTRYMENHPNGLIMKGWQRRNPVAAQAYLQRKAMNQSPQGGRLTGSQGWIKAQLTIDITRNSYNIPFALPVEMFNTIDLLTGSKLIVQYFENPDLQLLSANEDATLTNWVYTFRQISTGNQDTVTVSCQEVSYVKLIYGLMTDMITIGGGTVTVSDETQALQQFSQQIVFTEQNIFGKQHNNPINMGSFVLPSDFRKEIVNIKNSFSVDKQRGLVYSSLYINGTAQGYQLTTTWFLSISSFHVHSLTAKRTRASHADADYADADL